MPATTSNLRLQPGQRVRITQQVDTRTGPWTTQVEGIVRAVRAKPTGSWFAHGKNDKLWLTRVLLEKNDGEMVEINFEVDSNVEVLEDAPAK